MFSEQAIAFNQSLQKQLTTQPIQLPTGYDLMNPFVGGKASDLSRKFYQRFYGDPKQRRLILGINPGRHGAGLTGIPFTDTARMVQIGMDPQGIETYEPSAVFMYAMIDRLGGAEEFYKRFYINSPLPLGLLKLNGKGHWVNANYYDTADLKKATSPLIDYAMQQYQTMPIDRSVTYCLGQGKNFDYLKKLNDQHYYFEDVVALPHPRYVIQYKHKQMDEYIDLYKDALLSGENEASV